MGICKAVASHSKSGIEKHIFQIIKRKLQYVIKSIRSLECNSTFVADRNEAMHNIMIQLSKTLPKGIVHSSILHTVWYFLILSTVIHQSRCKKCRSCSSVKWPRFCSFRIKCGTETLYAALSWNLNSIGSDVLNLVDEAKHFRLSMVWIKLVSLQRCVGSRLSNAGIVWIDNQSWDEELTNKIFEK